jgi:hypothetical protein
MSRLGVPRVASHEVTNGSTAAGGFFAGTDPLLGEALGREPASVRDLLAAQLATAGH